MNKITNMVFEGGGPKGIAYGGALAAIDYFNPLSDLERVGGTSAGAITAVLVALDYSPAEITNIVSATNFSSFKDDSVGVFRDTWRLIRYYGWHPGNTIKQWMGRLIKNRLGDENATFRDLHIKVEKGIYGFKDLYIVCTNLTRQRVDTYSHENNNCDTPIINAVRMSMGIPFYFQRCVNKYGDIMVDGGLSNNYPIRLFDNKKYTSGGTNEESYVVNNATIGFRLDTKKEIEASKNAQKIVSKPVKTNNFIQFTAAVINFMMEAANKKHLSKADFSRTVFIDTEDVSATDFDLSDSQKKMLVRNGKKAVMDYFNSTN